MSRLNRLGSDTPVYFPSIVSSPSEEKKYTPMPPQRGKYYTKKHHHGTDSRVQLEPLRPPTGGNSSPRLLANSSSSEQLSLNSKTCEGGTITNSENARMIHKLEKKMKFYRQLATMKLREAVATEESLLKTIDVLLLATVEALDADVVVLYSLDDQTHTLNVTSCTTPGVVGFRIPVDKFAVEMVLHTTDTAAPTYVAKLQSLSSYDPAFDLDVPADFQTCSVLANVILDENGKPIFVVEVRSSREMTFSHSLFSAMMTTLENIVYQYDLKQVLTRTFESYGSLNDFLQYSITPSANGTSSGSMADPIISTESETPQKTQQATSDADMDLEALEWLHYPDLTKLIQDLVVRFNSEAICLLELHSIRQTCDILAFANSSSSKEPILHQERLSSLLAVLTPTNQDNNVEQKICLFHRLMESIEKAQPLDLSDDSNFHAVFTESTGQALIFLPLPSNTTCQYAGLLCISTNEHHSYDIPMLKPFISALAIATVISQKNDDMRTSTLQKVKLINLFNSHFQVETINDPSALVNMICDIGCEIFKTKRVTLYVADPIKNELWSLSTLGSVNGLRIPYGRGIAGTAAYTKETLIVRNPYDDPRFDRSFDIKLGFKTESLLTFPILDKNGDTLGVIQAVNFQHFMELTANPLISKFDERVLDVYKHLVSHALRINSSLIMFAKVQADYWANRVNVDAGNDQGGVVITKSEVASVHSLLDSSGFDEAKRVPRNKWSTFAYACWGLGKFLGSIYRQRRSARLKRIPSAPSSPAKNNDDDEAEQIDIEVAIDEAMRRVHSRTSSLIRAGRKSFMVNRWRRLALCASPVQEELLMDTFDPLTKSIDELKEYAYHLFEGMMLTTTFRIEESTLRRFISTLADKYRPVPYHSFYHGFDVALSSYCLMRKTNIINVIKEYEALSLMIAALGHDTDHPGNDNQFEIDSSSPLALCYNDISVLENHHAAMTFGVLKMEGCDILQDLSAQARVSVRTAIVRCILATDMKHHTRLLADLSSVGSVKDFELVTDGRQLMLNMIIHGSDLGSVARPLHITVKWVDRICQEFTQQAKTSAAMGLFVPPHIVNLEDEVVRCRLQMNFIDYLVAPLWTAIGSILPDAKTSVQYLQTNRDYFYERAGEISARRASITPSSSTSADKM